MAATQQKQTSFWKNVWLISIAVFAIGWYVTGSATWGYKSRWLNREYVVHRVRDASPESNIFTEEELAMYTGENPDLPIYLAIDGMVFDVSAKPMTYGPMGAYSIFSGKDAARAFATGCFNSDLTHDLRGLSEEQLAAVENWKNFFKNHELYWHAGYVNHPPLAGDPPAPCQAHARP